MKSEEVKSKIDRLLSKPVDFGGAEGQPVLTTKLSKDYIYSFRGDSSLLG